MLSKLLNLFKRKEKKPNRQPSIVVSYSYFNNNELLISVDIDDAEMDSNTLAFVVSYIGSVPGQLDIIDVVEQGLLSKNKKEFYESFVGHFLEMKSQEVLSAEQESEEYPCIKPSDML